MEQTIDDIEWIVDHEDVRLLALFITHKPTYATLRYSAQTGDLSLEMLHRMKRLLDDENGVMKRHTYELADARMQMLRLYRAIDMHTWKFAPWILGLEGSLGRTLRVIGLCMTPNTVFH